MSQRAKDYQSLAERVAPPLQRGQIPPTTAYGGASQRGRTWGPSFRATQGASESPRKYGRPWVYEIRSASPRDEGCSLAAPFREKGVRNPSVTHYVRDSSPGRGAEMPTSVTCGDSSSLGGAKGTGAPGTTPLPSRLTPCHPPLKWWARTQIFYYLTSGGAS